MMKSAFCVVWSLAFFCSLLWCCSAHRENPEASCGVLFYHDVKKPLGESVEVTYDDRSIIIDGRRTLLLSGAVHYPRVMEGEWSDVFSQMYLDGLNTVQTYLYWNLHEPVHGQQYDFSGNKNWVLFVEKAAQAGLFVVLRIGPFVASEWDYGAIPHWINDIPDMKVRSSNLAWEREMARFFTDMVTMAKPYLATNGGPIILAQIENEFHWDDPDYINWCGSLVKQVDLGIPFIMCNGDSASNTINTCNGNDCTEYAESHATKYPGQPLLWTEDEGWFQSWDKEPLMLRDNRTAPDVAFVVMKWFARGGAHHNYYMWYGGNNFGRLAAGSCVTNEYATGVNLQSDGLANEPKKTHLQRLHLLLSKYGNVLLNTSSQVDNRQMVLVLNATGQFMNATKQYAYVYQSYYGSVAFVENSAEDSVLVSFEGRNFSLPSLSSSLVEMASVSEVYNSAKVNTAGLPMNRKYTTLMKELQWQAWQESSPEMLNGTVVISPLPLEQLSVTKDVTDYLFYQTEILGSVSGVVNLMVTSRLSNSLLAFIDGKFQSSAEFCIHDEGQRDYSLTVNTIEDQVHLLTILSVSLGVNTHTEPGEFDLKGITGDVVLGLVNITSGTWAHRAMLDGEILEVYTAEGSAKVKWSSKFEDFTNKPLVWYQVSFDAPTVKSFNSLLLDLNGMGRGYIYLNGVNLGRYWLTMVGGVYVQRYYTVPQSLLVEKGNLLTLGEELGAQAPENVMLVESMLVV